MTSRDGRPTGHLVRVVWAYGGDRSLADRLLLELVSDGSGDPGAVRRLCPWCGSEGHGRPVVAGRARPYLSVARAGPLTMVAVCETAPVGVDLERFGAAGRTGEGLLHPAEPAVGGVDLTRTWVRKEALLKATGHGLRIDPATVALTAPDQPPELLAWPDAPAPTVRIHDVDAVPGHVAALAVVSADPVAPLAVRVSPAAGAVPPTTASR